MHTPRAPAPGGAADERLVVFSRCQFLSVREVSTPSQTWTGSVDFTFLVLVPRALDAALVAQSTADNISDSGERGDKSHPLVRRLGVVWPNRESFVPESLEVWVRRAGAPVPALPELTHEKPYDVADFGAAAGGRRLWVVRWAFAGTFSQPFELENFPFDEQELRVFVAMTQGGVEFAGRLS